MKPAHVRNKGPAGSTKSRGHTTERGPACAVITRLAFNPYYAVYTLGNEGVILLSEDDPQLLKGRLYTLVVPRIDGRRTTDDIVAELAGECSPAEVYFTLYRLQQKGFLIDQDAPPQMPYDPARTAFWKACGLEAAAGEARLREETVSVRAVGNVQADAVLSGLQALGVAIDEDGQLTIVLTDDYLRPELEDINREALASGRSWLLAKPVGVQIWLGPLFRPHATGCWKCLAHRLASNREVAAYLERRLQHGGPIVVSTASLPSTRAMGEEMVITEAARWLASAGKPGAHSRSGSLEGKIVTVDTRTWRTEEHILTRRPQCPACGEPIPRLHVGPRPLRLQSRKKGFTRDGAHRTVDPETTLATYRHLVSPITGVVHFLRREDGGRGRDPVIHTYVSGHNIAARWGSLADLRRHFRSNTAGKGMTDAQAKAGALAEAIERYSAVFQPGVDPQRWARYRELRDDAIHPHDLLLFSERQYRERDRLNARASRFQWVPEPFDEEATVSWTPVWSLTEERHKYVPTMACYFLYRSGCGEPTFSVACSNGNATGNTLEEAIVQGFLELVERDAVAIWWYNRLRRPAVDLDSFDEPYFTRLRERYDQFERDVWVLDITSDLNVPTFAAVSRRRNAEREEILFGFGAHFDAQTAVARALTEMNQMARIGGLAAPGSPQAPLEASVDDPDLLHWLRHVRVDDQRYLAPAEGVVPRRASDYAPFHSDDLRDDVLRCQAIVEGIGLEMLVLDLTRPDIGMPAVKVFVPGLRHFWARFAPGRLYDVPVARGELPRPLKEEELNRIPVFM